MHKLEAEVMDRSISAGERFSAASDIKFMIRTSKCSNATRQLVHACLSFHLNDLLSEDGHINPIVEPGVWRHFRLSDVSEYEEATRLPTPHLRLICRLLFEADRHNDSTQLFRALVEREAIAENVLQAAYNFENVARRTKNLDLVNEAIELIEKRGKEVLSWPLYSAEFQHILGHLYILKGRLSDDHTLSSEARGVKLLEQSHLEDPSYTSCYVFSYAEYGDYLTSIDRGVNILRTRPYGSLPKEDAEIIDLEIAFYLAYALMAIGEFEQAKLLLRYFMNATTRKSLYEARDHARLFNVKLELKRRGLNNIGVANFSVFADAIAALRFSSAESAQIRDENDRYKLVLKFLAFSSPNDIQDKNSLEGAYKVADTLISSLLDFSPTLLSDVGIYFGPVGSSGADSVETKLRKALPDSWGVVLCRTDDLDRHETIGNKIIPLALLWCSRDQPSISLDCPTLQVGTRASEKNSIVSLDVAIEICVVALARVAVTRFLYEDQYVYGIVPCTKSPAIKFQHPPPSLSELLP